MAQCKVLSEADFLVMLRTQLRVGLQGCKVNMPLAFICMAISGLRYISASEISSQFSRPGLRHVCVGPQVVYMEWQYVISRVLVMWDSDHKLDLEVRLELATCEMVLECIHVAAFSVSVTRSAAVALMAQGCTAGSDKALSLSSVAAC